MTKHFSKAAFLGFVFLTIAYSCVEKSKTDINKSSEITLSKQARLDSLLDSPININSTLKTESIDQIDFYKSYVLAENAHHAQYFQDSIIRYASLQEDVVEVLKNRYQEKITFLRFGSEPLHLKYGLYVGMSTDDFFTKMPEQEMQDHAILYDAEYASLKFYFDTNSNKLKQIFYTRYID